MNIWSFSQWFSNIQLIRDQPSLYRRYILTFVLLVIAFFAFTLFIFINLFLHKYTLACFDLVATLLTLISLYFLLNKNNLELAAGIAATLIFLFLIVFSYINKNESFGLAWAFCFPLFVIPLLGIKRGMWALLVFYSIIMSITYLGLEQWENGAWNWVSYIRFTLISMIIVFIAYFYESTSQKAFEIIDLSREKEQDYLKKLESQSRTDQLTDLYNRRYFDDQFTAEYEKIARYKNSFCLIMIDLDFFKSINDDFGHQTGDKVLQEFSELMKQNTRNSDVISRWGGEEFMLLLPNTDLKNAEVMAEKLRKATQDHVFVHKKPVTISSGVIEVASNDYSKREFMYKVDEALYTAKTTGRNKVVSEILSK